MRPAEIWFQQATDLPFTCDDSPLGPAWLRFQNPSKTIVAVTPAQVAPALEQVRALTEAGAWAAGYLAYEAAAGLDPAMAFLCDGRENADDSSPLLWFGIYDDPIRYESLPLRDSAEFEVSVWRATLSESDYREKVERIREFIAAGDTYQANFTEMLRADFRGDPQAWFAALLAAQRPAYAACLSLEGRAILSVSPELFFAQAGGIAVTRPMKGTAARGRWAEEDRRQAETLRRCPKNRAENLMIVDMLRNDLGRVARPGGVRVEELFAVERYPTLWQMTSRIAAETAGHPVETLVALFPCGSITGAPKIRTMQILEKLEAGPRGIYTGAIGWIGPRRQAQFNVAIRTIDLHQPEPGGHGTATYGVGGGVTWDSSSEGEYLESRTKARILFQSAAEDFQLLEALRWAPSTGFTLLSLHLERLAESAGYFDFAFEPTAIESALVQFAAGLPNSPHKVRLAMNRRGEVNLSAEPIAPKADGSSEPVMTDDHQAATLRVGLAATPVDESDPFLFHKTTRRAIYERALASRPDCDDVVLWNGRGELTESTRANLVVRTGGRWLTPSRECGLLAGTLRAQLLAEGRLQEAVLRREDLARGETLWLINSVRGWMPVHWIAGSQPQPISNDNQLVRAEFNTASKPHH